MTLTTLRLFRSNKTVAFRDHGGGAPLVFVHGVGMQSAAWRPQIEAFKTTHRVIAVDMPGHGQSEPLPNGSSLPDFVDWLQDFVISLDLGKINLLGHSMGGLIVGGFAARFPEFTERVALLNTVYCRDDKARSAVIARAAEIEAGKVDLETPLSRWFGDTPIEVVARKNVADWLRTVDLNGYATAYKAFATGDATYANALHNVTCPLLAITGDGDPNSTPAMSQAIADKVQNGRAVTIKGHRHMVNLTAPDDLNAHLAAWLKTPV